MADFEVDAQYSKDPEIDETLNALIEMAFGLAQEDLEKGEVLSPFTLTLFGENVSQDFFTGETPDEFRVAAELHVVRQANIADGYAFCYDGYLETNQGVMDAIIVEAAMKEDLAGVVYGLLYEEHDDKLVFEEKPRFIDVISSFLAEIEPEEDEAEDDETDED